MIQVAEAAESALVLAAQKAALLIGRTGGLFAIFPLGVELVPLRARVMVALTCALALYSSTAPPVPGLFPLQLIAEVAVGLCAALCARVPLAALEAGLQLSSLTSGLGIASLLNPDTSEEVHALTELLTYGALVAFLAMEGHHRLLLGLAESLRRVPLGAVTLAPLPLRTVIGLGGEVLLCALQLAAPVLLATLALNVALALVSRAAPTANIFSINLVAVLLVGLFTTLRGISAMAPVLRSASRSAAQHFLYFFGGG